MYALTQGQQIPLKNGDYIKIIEPIGKGGQGEVYSVDWNGSQYALKWYTNKSILSDEMFYHNLERLRKETESNKVHQNILLDYFTLPIILTEKKESQYGYVMKLIDTKKMHPLSTIMFGKNRFKDMETIYKACANLSQAFAQLELSELTFTDLNENGIFFDCETGEVCICDCDNITAGEYYKMITYPGMTAPELLNNPDIRPSELTDRHSLAVILFEMVMGEHPYRDQSTYAMTLEEQSDYFKYLAVHPAIRMTMSGRGGASFTSN